jgi:hypothetical protein
VFRGGGSELVEEAVMPDFGHVFPVVDNTVFDGICSRQGHHLWQWASSPTYTSLLFHANHAVVVLGPTDN